MDSLAAPDPTAVARTVQRNLPLWFEPQVLERAQRYGDSGAVQEVRHDPVSGELHAWVQGTDRHPYELTIRLPDQKGESLSAECSCPYGWQCKHAAAALLVWTQRKLAVVSSATPAAQRAAGPVAPPSRATKVWLQEAEALARLEPTHKATSSGPANATHELHFAIAPDAGGVRVSAVKRRLRKDGTVGGEEEWNNFHNAYTNPPGFAKDEDLAAFSAVARFVKGLNTYYAGHEKPLLAGKGADQALRSLLATGRLHWRATDGPRLSPGPARQVGLHWQETEGTWRVRLEVPGLTPGQAAEVLVAESPWAALLSDSPAGSQLVPAESPLPAPWLRLLAAAPALDVAAAARFKLLAEQAGVPAPEVPVEVTEGKPQPLLYLHVRVERRGRAGRSPTASVDYRAALSFRYGVKVVSLQDEAVLIPLASEHGVQRFMRRNHEQEQAAVGRLNALRLSPAPQATGWNARPEPPTWRWPHQNAVLGFLAQDAAQLEREGWSLDYAADWPLRPVEPDAFEGAVQRSTTDWFDLRLGVKFGRERFDLVALLASALAQFGVPRLRELLATEPAAEPGPRMLCPTDGRLIALPLARIRSALAFLLELFDAGELSAGTASLKLSRFDLARLGRLEQDSGTGFSGAAPLLALARRLRDFSGIDTVAQPRRLRADLRGYQLQGLAWMQFLREYGLAGVLADEMGLGKTVQTLAHVLAEKAARRMDAPVLVVAPTSVVPNWEREAARFAPSISVLSVHGKDRAPLFERVAASDLVLTSYALLARDARHWLKQSFHLVVLDEAQAIKNPRTQAAQTACALDARHRLALTGTPLENHLGEIWSLFRFLMPGLLGDEKRFERAYRRPIERQDDRQRRGELVARLAPFILRRTKERVAAELPPKTETQVTVRLESRQAELYETVRAAMDAKVRAAVERQGLTRSQITILDALLKLRQACCDPRLLPVAKAQGASAAAIAAAGSAKLDALMGLLDECRENGRRVLVFSQFTAMLDLMEPRLAQAGLRFVRLDGSTRDRAAPVARFQAGEADAFLISLKAGGTGLNLTAADTVIHYDPWWNPAVEAQATGRAHRIGQDKPVFVYRLICEGSVEEEIVALQQRKGELAAALLQGSTQSISAVSAEDLQALLAPLPPG